MASVILLKAPQHLPISYKAKTVTSCHCLKALPALPLISFLASFHTFPLLTRAFGQTAPFAIARLCHVLSYAMSLPTSHLTFPPTERPRVPQASVQESLPLGSPHKCPTSTSTQAEVEVGSPFSPLASGPTSSPQLPGDLVIPCWDTCLSPRNKAGSQGKQWLFYLLSSCQQWGSNQSAIFSFLHFIFHTELFIRN